MSKIWSSHSTIRSRFDKPYQSWSPSNFLELPHWVPPHRFRWKSRIHLESSCCFQAGLLFINIVWGTVRNCKLRQNVWYVEWKKQASLHRWDSWHGSVCNTDSPIHIHKFIPSKGFNSIQCWNQCLKYYSSSIFKWRQNHMTFSFFLEIFPHTL